MCYTGSMEHLTIQVKLTAALMLDVDHYALDRSLSRAAAIEELLKHSPALIRPRPWVAADTLRVAKASDVPLATLPIARRTYNALRRAGYRTVSDVESMTDADIMALRNIGIATLADIRAVLLGPSEPPPDWTLHQSDTDGVDTWCAYCAMDESVSDADAEWPCRAIRDAGAMNE